MKQPLELLAPARNADIARQAILHGADAVYMGAWQLGARAAAGNSIDDIRRTAEFAHVYDARLFVTVNTLVYDSELDAARDMIWQLYDAGVDAIIIQDLGLLSLDLPPIELHASTQCDIRTPEKAVWLASLGFRRLVLPREFSLGEIRAVRDAVPADVEIEAFVHGALCVSYSGDCQASYVATGRSANRGECAQLCRLQYRLTDSAGRQLAPPAHYLSLKDLNRINSLGDMARAGVMSFKIEGRLKEESYVKNVVSAYRAALDSLIDANPDCFTRASAGVVTPDFVPDPDKSFNRTFTPYFLTSPDDRVGRPSTPKFTGVKIGRVAAVKGNAIVVETDVELHNGDGLGYFNPDDTFAGFRINRAEPPRGNRQTIVTPDRADVAPGTVLYRNRDIEFDRRLAAPTASRLIPVDIALSRADETVTLEVTDATGLSASASAVIAPEKAVKSQADTHRRAVDKLGATPFALRTFDDSLTSEFIPVSAIAALRREAVERLIAMRSARVVRNLRPVAHTQPWLKPRPADYHDNIANCLSRALYAANGIAGADALELTPHAALRQPLRVMTSRYCLRRQLGCCLKTKDGAKLPPDLRLRAPGIDFELRFDCKNCRMEVISHP